MPRIEIGLWGERFGKGNFGGRPALFLDRDGVVVEEVDFLSRPQDVRLTDGIAEAIASANRARLAVVIVTNQSGIARGYYGWPEFEAVQAKIAEELSLQNAHMDLVLACGYHKNGLGNLARDHPWRKPGTGMLLEARDLLGIDLVRSYIVGDRLTDLAAGKSAGLEAGALVSSGYGSAEATRHAGDLAGWKKDFPVTIEVDAAVAIAGWLRNNSAGEQIS